MAAAGRDLGMLGKTQWAQARPKPFMFGSKSGNFTFDAAKNSDLRQAFSTDFTLI